MSTFLGIVIGLVGVAIVVALLRWMDDGIDHDYTDWGW